MGRLSVEDSIGIALQICAGLREAHAQGIVHRDLKPANVMLDLGGVVKIMDFGIARLSQSTTQDDQVRSLNGTPAYMAPEQLELRSLWARARIYMPLAFCFMKWFPAQPRSTGTLPIFSCAEADSRAPQTSARSCLESARFSRRDHSEVSPEGSRQAFSIRRSALCGFGKGADNQSGRPRMDFSRVARAARPGASRRGL